MANLVSWELTNDFYSTSPSHMQLFSFESSDSPTHRTGINWHPRRLLISYFLGIKKKWKSHSRMEILRAVGDYHEVIMLAWGHDNSIRGTQYCDLLHFMAISKHPLAANQIRTNWQSGIETSRPDLLSLFISVENPLHSIHWSTLGINRVAADLSGLFLGIWVSLDFIVPIIDWDHVDFWDCYTVILQCCERQIGQRWRFSLSVACELNCQFAIESRVWF